MTRDFVSPTTGSSPNQHWRSLIATGLVLGLSLSSFSITTSAARDREVLSPGELAQIGLVQAWRRQLSVPAGTASIVDHAIIVHQTSPKQYVEVVAATASPAPAQPEAAQPEAAQPEAAKPEASQPAAAEQTPPTATGASPEQAKPAAGPDAAAARTIYARYLLEVPDTAEEASLTSQVSKPTPGSMLDRMTFAGRTNFASSGLLDRNEAERRARNDIRRLKRRGIEAEIQAREVPLIRMYTLADDGTVESRDAETGELVWVTRVGDRVLGYGGMGVGDHFISIVNGGDLIRLDVSTGGVFGVDRLRYVPTQGPRHSGGYAVIPSMGNRMAAYPLDDVHGDVFSEIVRGASLAPATLAIGSEKIAWGTSDGFVYVMKTSVNPAVEFRLGTDGVVDGALAAAPGDRFFFGSASGQIYGLRATRTGEVLWSRPTGDPIFDSPIVSGDKVLFRSTYGNLMCVDAATGEGCWDRTASGIDQVLAVINDQVYARSLGGSFVVLSLSDGRIVQQLHGASPQVLRTNVVSDRLYLIDRRGTVQCLHRPGADMPTLPMAVEPPQEEETPDQDAGKSKRPAADAPANDPFGPGASDPFGGGGVDPFGGGGADPFGAGGDPFAPAGGNDPFGN